MQKVEVYVSISGYYCAFHEVNFRVLYDITNKKYIEGYEKEYSLEYMKNFEAGEDSDYMDIEKRDAYLIDGKYYVKW